MTALYWLIPAALVMLGLALWLLFWAIGSGQYDDLESPGKRLLFDEHDPAHHAAQPTRQPTDEP
ncbi:MULTISPECIES: cbb3-type cytochrome oxidase assembly protein CcoS [unclassified Pseudomonas]|uniref:cbb3-type cytochrome oxidase assembly protein CcoS n=1 Tax=unclassified Pseudomonas TaxID=196821 RepID=UPI000BD70B4F|nr:MULTISPECIES: cbb3-type cytochrome oxidase assembly protein CcoS [unclassified Pseudomonas]PVZ13894.1 cbb3-type cytochrome oxidase maturation protein [Pseudomonas sp. URIL14HWK12:I12]PVZ24200.1 cbb3-type cytochrome oxidase maturation protein [Pseudomonas sp. URIL14HWK12:I10]PVZ33161.1 cbb3-type cytochrome oxidase maturation protein [Pseudomonas sp. URIL14HWK12:I11]SNZ10565.1 cytochrome oxidase maturation protein, cbb3-type [Pseudomonas sp. URIL14HWK12:I9]